MAITNNIPVKKLYTESWDSLKKHREHIVVLIALTIGIPLVISAFWKIVINGWFYDIPRYEQLFEIMKYTQWESSLIIPQMSTSMTLFDISDIWLIIGSLFISWLLYLYIFQHEKWTYTWNLWVVKEFFNKIPKLIGTNILLVLWLMLAFILLIVPWIIYAIFWTFTISIVLYYGNWWRAAMKKSYGLVKWRRRKTFGVILGFVVLVGILQLLWLLILWAWYRYFWRNPLIDLLANVLTIGILTYSAFFTAHFFLSRKDSAQSEEILEEEDTWIEEIE